MFIWSMKLRTSFKAVERCADIVEEPGALSRKRGEDDSALDRRVESTINENI